MNQELLLKPFAMATIGEVLEAAKAILGRPQAETPPTVVEYGKKYVHGVRGLAKLCGCSISTAQRRISSGILDECIIRSGRMIIIDSEAALEALKKESRNG
jgi:hypothetical protein